MCRTTVPTAQRTLFLSVRAARQLKVSMEIITPYSESHTERMSTSCDTFHASAAVTYNKHWYLTGQQSYIEVKQSHYRPGVAQRVPGS